MYNSTIKYKTIIKNNSFDKKFNYNSLKINNLSSISMFNISIAPLWPVLGRLNNRLCRDI